MALRALPRKRLLQLRSVRGSSMLPTLTDGQLVLFVSGRAPRVGEIVMVRHAGVEKIKRVARIDGGRVWLLGDNPSASTDSRTFGWLGLEAVRGVLLWPRLPKIVQ